MIYDVDLEDGRTVTLESDKEPTHDEIYAALANYQEQPKADIFRGPSEFEQAIVPAGLESGRFDLSQNPIHPAPTLTQEASQFGQDVTSTLGNVARAIPADVAAGLSLLKRPENQPQTLFPSPTAIAGAISQNMPYAIETAGNIPAALAGEPLPIDKTLSEAATESVPAATIGKISQGVAATAPMAIIGVLPAAAQKAALLAFTAKMISDAPEVATQLGTELGKPKDEQDPDKISGLVSDAIQITGFSILGGTHLAKSGFDFIKKPSTTGEVYAPETRKVEIGNQQQYPGTDAQRQATEAGSGNRVIGSPPSEALPPQQPQAVETKPMRISMQRLKIYVEGGTPEEHQALANERQRNVVWSEYDKNGDEIATREYIPSTQVQAEAPGQTTAPKVGEPAAPAVPEQKVKPLGMSPERQREVLNRDIAQLESIAKNPDRTRSERENAQQAADNLKVRLGELAKSEPGPGIVGLGGATPSELVPGTGQDIYSIAQAGREARASAGQVAPVKPGEGTTLPDSIEHGRELLGQDATAADKAIARFEADPEKAVSANGIAVTRAKGEELSLAARRIEEKFGTDSPEYRLAWKSLSDWDARTKPMQTEWQKMGVAQQGATDIDTGSITGLQRAYKENTGQDFNPPQMKKAAKIVAGVKKADVIVETAKPVLQTAIDAIPEKVKTPDDIPGQKNTFAGYESGKPMTDEQVKIIWKRAKSYIDFGMDDKPAIIFKVASDLGIESKDVLRGMSKTRQVKRVADDVWQKQRQARILKDLAKRWVYKANETWASKIIPVTARSAFAAKTGLHGTVAMGTHAPLVVATHPKIFAENFGKMYKLVASPEYYQMQQYELSRRPNYNVAQRAGLVNDMSKMEDFSDPNITQGFPKIAAFFKSKLDKAHLGRLVGMGTRGYSVLKVLRQDLFDHEWNKLADGDKSPDMAKAIADTVNHITGVVKAGAPTGAHYALFAPKLLLSRLAVVGRDPAIAANSLLKMENMSPSEKWFLKNQVKEKAKIFAVASGLLSANQALNNFLGDKKKLNGVPESLGGGGWDPMKSDFMKFRVAGMNFAWGSPFLTMMRLPLRIIRIGMGDGGKSKNLIYPDESMAYEAFKYARTQESPFLNPIVSLITKADYAGRPLPQIPGYGPPPPVPKRLAAQGVKPYTWPEFIAETVLPIPFQEGAKEIFHYASSGDADKEKALMKGFLTTLIMGATGGRVGEDWEKPQTPVRRALVQQ